MKTLTSYFVLLALFFCTTLIFAEVIQWQPCSAPNENSVTDCTIHHVKMEPCVEVATGKSCSLQKGHQVRMSLDFTPNFSGENLINRLYCIYPFNETYTTEIEWFGMEDTNACHATACPVSSGTRQTYEISQSICRFIVPGTYNMMWKMWNTEGKQCCFTFLAMIHE